MSRCRNAMSYTTTLRAVGQLVGQDGAASAQRATASLLGFRTSRRKSREPAGGMRIRPRISITCVSSVPPCVSAVARPSSGERRPGSFMESFKRATPSLSRETEIIPNRNQCQRNIVANTAPTSHSAVLSRLLGSHWSTALCWRLTCRALSQGPTAHAKTPAAAMHGFLSSNGYRATAP